MFSMLAKFHVVSSLFSVLKVAIWCYHKSAPALHLQWVWPENENTVNLKSAFFVIIMLLHEGLTRLHFGKSFTLIIPSSKIAVTRYASLIETDPHRLTLKFHWIRVHCVAAPIRFCFAVHRPAIPTGCGLSPLRRSTVNSWHHEVKEFPQ